MHWRKVVQKFSHQRKSVHKFSHWESVLRKFSHWEKPVWKFLHQRMSMRNSFSTLCKPWEWASKLIKRCKEEDQRKKSIMKQFCMVMRNLHMLCEIQRTAVARPIWSTSWSLLSTYYISFRSLGSQESNSSNGVQFRAETRKLWLIEGNCTKLKRNFALTFPDAKIFALTFPDAKIFSLTFPNVNIFAAHFPNAKI